MSPGYVGEDGRPQLSSVRSWLKLKGLYRGVDQGELCNGKILGIGGFLVFLCRGIDI